VARFINAPSPNEVIFTRGTTEGINLIAATWGAANLRPGDEVILTIAEHNSNLLPWTRAAHHAGATVRVVDVDDDGRLRLDQLKQLTTSENPAHRLQPCLKRPGARQPGQGNLCRGAAGWCNGRHRRRPVGTSTWASMCRTLGCDFYVFSGHKMLGPMAIGVVWGRLELLDSMPAYHVGSNMAHEADFERAAMEHGALKFQAGTPDVAGPVGLAAAIDCLTAIGKDAMWRHDQDLVRHGLARLHEVKGLRVIGSSSAQNRVPVFTLRWTANRRWPVAAAMDTAGIAVAPAIWPRCRC
jgi:cysteine desulfurase/selenocysteine lyase